MLPSFLLTERQVHDSGFTAALDLGTSLNEPIEIILGITHAKEQQALDLPVLGFRRRSVLG